MSQSNVKMIRDALRAELQEFASGALSPLLDDMVRQLGHGIQQELHKVMDTRGIDVDNGGKRHSMKAGPSAPRVSRRCLGGSKELVPNRAMHRSWTAVSAFENSQSSHGRLSQMDALSRVLSDGDTATHSHEPSKFQNRASISEHDCSNQARREARVKKKKSPATLRPASLFETSAEDEASWLLDPETTREGTIDTIVNSDRALQEVADSNGCHKRVSSCVLHRGFDYITGLMVILNAATLGWETDITIKTDDYDTVKPTVNAIEATFCAFFVVELSMRVLTHGRAFCRMEGWQWNVFDSIIVGLQVIDMLERSLESLRLPLNVGVLRMLRLLRLVRITRLVRILHLFDDLRSIIASMWGSMSTLCLALMLLFLMVYIFGVFILQVMLHAGTNPANSEDLSQYFSSLKMTCFTLLECVWGGINWDNIVQPLMREVSPAMGLIFAIYIGVSLLAMMNMITAVFVDKVTKTVREDKDFIMANKIAELFFNPENPDGEISWDYFNQRLTTDVMQEYFKVLDINPIEGETLARALFDILDEDSSGGVNVLEMVTGILRLRGPAKALDLAMLSRDLAQVQSWLLENQRISDMRLLEISNAVVHLK